MRGRSGSTFLTNNLKEREDESTNSIVYLESRLNALSDKVKLTRRRDTHERVVTLYVPTDIDNESDAINVSMVTSRNCPMVRVEGNHGHFTFPKYASIDSIECYTMNKSVRNVNESIDIVVSTHNKPLSFGGKLEATKRKMAAEKDAIAEAKINKATEESISKKDSELTFSVGLGDLNRAMTQGTKLLSCKMNRVTNLPGVYKTFGVDSTPTKDTRIVVAGDAQSLNIHVEKQYDYSTLIVRVRYHILDIEVELNSEDISDIEDHYFDDELFG